jgi:hypothetical protein
VKVVEGSEINNFHIHHIVHFYSNFGRKSRSNRGTPSKIWPRARSRARLPRASAARLGVRATPRAFPTQLAPSRGSTHAEEPRSPRCPPARAPERVPPYVSPCPTSYGAARPSSRLPALPLPAPCSRVPYKGAAAFTMTRSPLPVARPRPWGQPRRAPVVG